MTRVVVALLSLILLAAPLAAEAQPARRVYQIGVLSIGAPPIPPEPPRRALVEALRELGYADGRNVTFHWRWAEDRFETLPGLAADLVRLDVDIILTFGTTAAKAAKEATGTIPIVFSVGTDPVKQGLVTSLARPGGTSRGSPQRQRLLSGSPASACSSSRRLCPD
jgi:putative ABC transport system substrate-binding protein